MGYSIEICLEVFVRVLDNGVDGDRGRVASVEQALEAHLNINYLYISPELGYFYR
jgi:hypothetical protein